MVKEVLASAHNVEVLKREKIRLHRNTNIRILELITSRIIIRNTILMSKRWKVMTEILEMTSKNLERMYKNRLAYIQELIKKFKYRKIS